MNILNFFSRILFFLIVSLSSAYSVSFDRLCDYFVSVNSAIQTPDGGYLLAGYSAYSRESGGASIKKIGKDLYLQWEKTFDRGRRAEAYFIAPTQDRNFIVIGYTEPGKEEDGNRDIWLFKIDKNGKLKWQTTIGYKYWDNVYSLFQTRDKGFVLGGIIEREQNEGNGLIIKLDKYGKIQWKKSYGDKNRNELIYSVVQTEDGGYAFVGLKEVPLKKEKTMKIWIGKLNARGNLLWEKVLNNSGKYDVSFAIAPSLSGGIVVAVSGDQKYWFMEFDKSGKSKWKKTFRGDAVPCFLIRTQDGNYVAVISYPEESDREGKLIKFNKRGTVLWTTSFGKSPLYIPTSLKQLKDGSFILTGFIRDRVYCNALESWVMKFNSNGKLLWIKHIDGKFVDELNSVIQAKDGNFAVLGFTDSTGNHNGDVVLMKFNKIGKLITRKVLKSPDEEYPHSIIETPKGDFVLSVYVRKLKSMNEDSQIIILNKKWKILKSISVTKKYNMKVNRLVPANSEGFYVIGNSAVLKFDESGKLGWKRKLKNVEEIFYAKEEKNGVFLIFAKEKHSKEGKSKILNAILIKDGKIIKKKRIVLRNQKKYEDIVNVIETTDKGIAVLTRMPDDSSTPVVRKYDKYGRPQWSKRIIIDGSLLYEGILLQTQDDNYAVVGTCSFLDLAVACIIKLDKNGKIEWENFYKGDDANTINSAFHTRDGGFIVVSTIECFKDIGNMDGLMQKIDRKGHLQWEYWYHSEK